MFVECKVHLCIPTRPFDKCPDPCLPSTNTSTLAEWLSTTIYTIRSGAINILSESITANPKPPAGAATNLSEGMAAGVATATANGKETFLFIWKTLENFVIITTWFFINVHLSNLFLPCPKEV